MSTKNNPTEKLVKEIVVQKNSFHKGNIEIINQKIFGVITDYADSNI